MKDFPSDLYYTKDHEWIRVNGNKGIVGITDFAQKQLADVAFVELPQPDSQVTQSKPFGVVESVKTVSDLYAPISGKVLALNKELETQPQLVNEDPYVKGWLMEIELSSPDEVKKLLSADEYADSLPDE